MDKRRPNESQYWLCSNCNRRVIHQIYPNSSKWIEVDGVQAYRRWHEHMCQGNTELTTTYEITEKVWKERQAELSSLRAENERLKELIRGIRDDIDSEISVSN
jgi:hypothetical protein